MDYGDSPNGFYLMYFACVGVRVGEGALALGADALRQPVLGMEVEHLRKMVVELGRDMDIPDVGPRIFHFQQHERNLGCWV